MCSFLFHLFPLQTHSLNLHCPPALCGFSCPWHNPSTTRYHWRHICTARWRRPRRAVRCSGHLATSRSVGGEPVQPRFSPFIPRSHLPRLQVLVKTIKDPDSSSIEKRCVSESGSVDWHSNSKHRPDGYLATPHLPERRCGAWVKSALRRWALGSCWRAGTSWSTLASRFEAVAKFFSRLAHNQLCLLLTPRHVRPTRVSHFRCAAPASTSSACCRALQPHAK